jgi:hypothetical protein
LAGVQHGVANTATTRTRIAPTSKYLTSLAALLLAEDGLLDLDAPVTPNCAGCACVSPHLRCVSSWVTPPACAAR